MLSLSWAKHMPVFKLLHTSIVSILEKLELLCSIKQIMLFNQVGMIKLIRSANFKNERNLEPCACGAVENMKHIYTCKFWNQDKEEEIEYDKIFTNDIPKQLKISRRFFRNFEKREKHKNERGNVPHVIHVCDPLAS